MKPWWLSLNRFGLFSIKERDYFQIGNLNSTLKERLETFVGAEIVDYKFLCGGRFLNYIFNPVSFYFIETKERKRKLIVEIWNTFGEFKPLVIDEVANKFEIKFTKNFYISPFLPMDTEISIEATYPEGENGSIRIISQKNGEEVYADWNFSPLGARIISLFPYSFKVSFAIHLQALKLFLKKIKYYKKQDDREKQLGFYLWNK
ncbi:PF07103 family protein [Bacteriovorax sp. Seq25_V]|nr:PF07103 family protein [Bacteriovorax sp. Seq25_V]